MIATILRLNDNLEELIEKPVKGFSYFACFEDLTKHPGGYVPWHWHADIELIWVLQGSFRMDTNHHSYVLEAGEGAFINSNVLHYKEPLAGPAPFTLDQLFDVSLLSGGYTSIFEQKYILPIIECKELEVMLFQPSRPDERRILELMRHAYDAADMQNYGYEFTVRNDLSEMWALMYKLAEPILQGGRTPSGHGEERIKQMLLFIRQHYQERIALGEIAAAANISERECLRCFQQNLNTTPFTYLMEYRIRRAAAMLREKDASVTEIAYSSGFSGTSYFGKIFKEVMGCTPSAYRLQQRENAEKKRAESQTDSALT